MPQVPGVPENQVSLNPLSGQRFDAPDIGAGGRMIGQSMQKFGGDLQQAANDFDEIAALHDEADAKTLDAQYTQFERDRLFNPESGFYNQRSADAIAARPVVEEDLAKKRGELLAATKTKRARQMLETVFARRGEETANGIVRHVSEQTRAFNIDSIGARVGEAQENYITYLNTDPKRAGDELHTIQSEFARLADLEGWNDPAILNQKREEILGGVHAGYIEAEALRDPLNAAKYLDEHRSEISAGDERKLDGMLRPLVVSSYAEQVAGLASLSGSSQPVAIDAPTDAPGGAPAAMGSTDQVWHAMTGDERAGPGRARGAEGGTDSRTGRFLTSSAGAVGPAQILEGTAKEMAGKLGVAWDRKKWLSDFKYNKLLGRAYFNEQLARFGGDVAKAVAAYNAGPGGVIRAMRRAGGADWRAHLPAETKKYLVNVLGPQGQGGVAVAPSEPAHYASAEQSEHDWIDQYVPEKFADKPPLLVKQITDQAHAQVREKYQRQRASQNQAEADQWDAVQESVASQGGWDAVTSTKQIPGFNSLPGDKKNQVLNVVNANLKEAANADKPAKIETNWEYYAQLQAMTPAQLANEPVDRMRANLGNEEFKEFSKKRVKPDEGKAVTYNGILSASAPLLAGAGLSLTGLKGKQKDAVTAQRSEFLGDMSNWANSYHRANGKWPDSRAIQDKADLMLIEAVWTVDGEQVRGRMFEAPEDQIGAGKRDTIRIIVPPDIRARILKQVPGASRGEVRQLYVVGKKRGDW